MPEIKLKFGKGALEVNIPEHNLQDVLHGEFPLSPTPEEEAAELLRALRGRGCHLVELVEVGHHVAAVCV
jgi:hypothetical protein